ncbi:MAG: hypothetical protein PWP24_48 [Clostridiales bacterium]|nr:hypothetical protein [Clostridiales bacterium]
MEEFLYQKRGFLKEDFKLFHIKDASLNSIDYHYHDFHKIFILLSGSVIYNIEGHSYPLHPLDIVLISRNELHRPQIDFSLPYERMILYTNLSDDNILSQCFHAVKQQGKPVVRLDNLASTPLYHSLMQLEHALPDEDFGNSLYMSALFTEFMVLLNRSILHKEGSIVSANLSPNKIHQILSYINDHLKEDLSIDQLSASFYISKYHLMRTFKEETGYSLHSYITDKRLLYAKDLLFTVSSLEEVCYFSGFTEYSTFLRAFKKKYQVSPSTFRRLYTKNTSFQKEDAPLSFEE